MKDNPTLIPKDICKEAQDFVKSIVSVLRENDMLNPLDFNLIELAAWRYHRIVTARKHIDKNAAVIESSGNIMRPNPSVKIEIEETRELVKILNLLGMSPDSRKEINKSKEKIKNNESPLEKFIKDKIETRVN